MRSRRAGSRVGVLVGAVIAGCIGATSVRALTPEESADLAFARDGAAQIAIDAQSLVNNPNLESSLVDDAVAIRDMANEVEASMASLLGS